VSLLSVLVVEDGIVVCEEFAELLTEVWYSEVGRQLDEQEKKRKQEVLKRWRRLTRGLLIRAMIKEKYNADEEEEVQDKGEREEKKRKRKSDEDQQQQGNSKGESDEDDDLGFEDDDL